MKKIVFIVVALAGLAACQSADKKATVKGMTAEEKTKSQQDTTNYTTIQWLDSTTKDLGKVKEGQVVEVTYRFKNTGDKNLIVSNVSAGCGCTIPETPQEPIAPGAEGVIRAKFDSRNHPGVAQKPVYVTANTKPVQQHQLNFKVEVITN